jgi:hypothetical protein
MKEVLLIVVGASIALISSWVKSWVERETACSNEIYKQRISCLNKIWCSFYEVKEIYGAKIPLGHNNWVTKHGDEAEEKLNVFRRTIDESQIILSKEIVSEFRELDTYLFTLLHEDDQTPSNYIKQINSILEKISIEINKHMNKRVYQIDLHLRT